MLRRFFSFIAVLCTMIMLASSLAQARVHVQKETFLAETSDSLWKLRRQERLAKEEVSQLIGLYGDYQSVHKRRTELYQLELDKADSVERFEQSENKKVWAESDVFLVNKAIFEAKTKVWGLGREIDELEAGANFADLQQKWLADSQNRERWRFQLAGGMMVSGLVAVSEDEKAIGVPVFLAGCYLSYASTKYGWHGRAARVGEIGIGAFKGVIFEFITRVIIFRED